MLKKERTKSDSTTRIRTENQSERGEISRISWVEKYVLCEKSNVLADGEMESLL